MNNEELTQKSQKKVKKNLPYEKIFTIHSSFFIFIRTFAFAFKNRSSVLFIII